MHIHGNFMNLNAMDSYSAADKAAAAQRAADVRKKLTKSAGDIEATGNVDEAYLLGQWMDGRHSQVLSGDEYHATATGKDPEFG